MVNRHVGGCDGARPSNFNVVSLPILEQPALSRPPQTTKNRVNSSRGAPGRDFSAPDRLCAANARPVRADTWSPEVLPGEQEGGEKGEKRRNCRSEVPLVRGRLSGRLGPRGRVQAEPVLSGLAPVAKNGNRRCPAGDVGSSVLLPGGVTVTQGTLAP